MINKIVESILAHPYELQMGAGKLSRRYSSRLGTQITRENILEAKLIAKGGIPKKEPNILLIDISSSIINILFIFPFIPFNNSLNNRMSYYIHRC